MIQSYHDSLYVKKQQEDLYFAMERLNSDNDSFWDKITSNAFKQGAHANDKRLIAGADGLRDVTISHLLHPQTHEVWMLYASTLCIDAQNPPKIDQVEMVCSVSTSPKVPFTNHMGIFRNPSFKEKSHPRISIDLHSFGASVMRLKYPEKIYMITTPMRNMEKIFNTALGSENVHQAHYESLPETIALTEQKILKLKEEGDTESLPSYEAGLSYLKSKLSGEVNPILSIGRGYSSFHLKTLDGAPLLKLNEEEMKESDYSWYFGRVNTFISSLNIVAISLATLSNLPTTKN